MTIDQLSNPTTIAIIVLFLLAFVRFGVWWAVLRVFLRPLLGPVGLVAMGAAAVAVIQLG